MNKPFGLSDCTRKYNRRRKLGGEKIFYSTFFEPKGMNRKERKEIIDKFKHPKTDKDKVTSQKMIEYSLKEFFKIFNIEQFDVVGSVSSTSNVNKIILETIKNKYKNKVKIIPNLILKTRIRNISIRYDIINKEKSLRTKETIPRIINKIKKESGRKISKVSFFPTRLRRYLGGFIKINKKYISDIENKKILLIDDTYGEGLTLCESSRLLKDKIKCLTCFTVMKDFSTK